MAPVPASVVRQAELLRIAGNCYFRKDRLGAAIDAYTEAIALCPDVALYRTNRALCYMKRNQWGRVEEDCRTAIGLDSSSVKAFDLERSTKNTRNMVEDIWQVLAKAKYMEWESESSARLWKLQQLKEACEKALLGQHFLDVTEDKSKVQESTDQHKKQLENLNEFFRKAVQVDEPKEVPDYLCCKITLDIFRDPVITPSGITYERAVLLKHIKRVGNFDPITRVPLEPHQLAPNLAIKEAV